METEYYSRRTLSGDEVANDVSSPSSLLSIVMTSSALFPPLACAKRGLLLVLVLRGCRVGGLFRFSDEQKQCRCVMSEAAFEWNWNLK